MIRLVSVIVLVAFLAITAAVKMLGIQSDARKSTLNSIASTMHTTSEIVHTKAIVNGLTSACYIYKDETTLRAFIEGIYICNGYPTAHIDNVKKAFNISEDLEVNNRMKDGGRIAYVSFKEVTYHTDNITKMFSVTPKCYVSYRDAKKTSDPKVYDVQVELEEC
ncbi:histidine kinase [Photobacterium lutimaris]|uniref:Histidine kinase n=1 Tax=Photobacterium lutimaris TaxID=388278 RepID=A0A2T3J4W4_9GAMM|nr:histidine kinase [Photobacterium lutimaris]PSU36325.1 histidine kinase [Photobacterium lutimaris]TDR74782.1 MSHA pilin protein MshA [Photobacterium lutimaris]